MALNIHILDSNTHRDFLAQQRRDPVTRELLKAGDRVVICAGCKSAFLADSWNALGGQHCNQSQTLRNIPDNELSYRFKRTNPERVTQSVTFKDPTSLTRWAKGLLYLQIVITVIALISGVLEYKLLNDFKNGVYSSEEQAVTAGEANDFRQMVIGIIQVIITVALGIFILKWIYRANFNARQLGATDMQFTPGWSVGWYFIPVANLWKPYQSMKEIWKASINPIAWKTQPVPSLLGWWWFFWIVSNMIGQASFRMASVDEINEFIIANVVTLLSDVTQLFLNFVFLIIVAKVYQMQMSHLRIPRNNNPNSFSRNNSYCGNCGERINAGSFFCQNCGKDL
jgi:hypothetical protein